MPAKQDKGKDASYIYFIRGAMLIILHYRQGRTLQRADGLMHNEK